MGYVFSTGRLVYNDVEVGTLSDVSMDNSETAIPLPSNMRAPVKSALGPGKASISCKFNAFDPSFLATLTNAAMAPAAAEIALVWYLTDTAGVVKSITFPNVTVSGIKLSAGADKWLECDMTFEAACAGGTGNLYVVATEAGGVPALDPITSKWAFSTGTLTLQTHAVGTLSGIDLDISFQTIPLTSNYRYPIAVAQGPMKVSGSTKFTALDTNFIETVANAVMAAPTSELTAVWAFVDTGGVTHTITLPNVLITGKKASAGADKWFETDVTFEAAAAAGDSNILEVT
jgi:hypothetical protein